MQRSIDSVRTVVKEFPVLEIKNKLCEELCNIKTHTEVPYYHIGFENS